MSGNGFMGFRLPKVENRALKYGYSNARVRAMRGLLLRTSALDELIRVGTIEGMVELLQRTGYKNDLSGAGISYAGSALIETAASRNFSRTVRKLIRITPESDRMALKALLIRWDLLNIKTMMHAKRIGRSYEEVRPHLFEVGGLSEDDFRRIMKADPGNLLKELRRTELGRKMLSMSAGKLNRQMKESFSNAFRSLDTFMQMESVTDAYMFIFMDEALAESGGKEMESVRSILRREIDAKNVMIIERLKKHSSSREKILGTLIHGGTLGDQLIGRLIEAKDLNATLGIIRSKFPQLDTKDKLTLAELEIALEKSIAAQKVLAFHRAILSAGVIIGFLLLKEEEINNLRKIAKGKEFGMSEQEVRSMLVVV
ncbi:MAG: V-type ATPase subunit [Candidatus Micrarchaeota archaeon]